MSRSPKSASSEASCSASSARRFGEARGIALAAFAFGLAHLGVYKIAVYQTVLLGVGFGAAYAAGGYPAAVLTHIAWNLSLVL